MTEKEQLIARVTELSAKLGRDADITGTVAELKARVEELEAELADNSNSLNGGGSDGQLSPHVAQHCWRRNRIWPSPGPYHPQSYFAPARYRQLHPAGREG